MKWLMTPIIAIALSGCMITGKTSDGFSIVKPSQAQINSAAKRIVCESFKPLTFDDRYDSSQTIAEIRRANARRASFGCK